MPTSIPRWPAMSVAVRLTCAYVQRSISRQRRWRTDGMRFVNHLSDSLNGLVSRRGFMRGLGGLGAGLVISVKLGAAADAQRSGAAAVMQSDNAAETIDAPGFVAIGDDETVTVMIKHLEMGQGPYTGLCTLVAEELDADWAQMRAEGARSNAALYKNLAFGMQGTGGSTAMANSYEQMRKAGATARAMLVAAAAQNWGVPESEITVVKGLVSHNKSGEHARFAELADQAAKLTPPQNVKLKDPSRFTLIGTTVPKLDTRAKSDGSAIYTIDVDPPEMLTVVIAHPPRFGAKAAKVDDSVARKVRGVTDVKVTPHGVAVYADGFLAAKKTRGALKIEWDDFGAAMRGNDQLIGEDRKQAEQPGKKATERGTVESALSRAIKMLQAEYIFPYLAHAPMEPLDCAIEARNGACQAWFGSQLQTVDHKTIAKVMGLPEEKVKINTLFAGGSFGRRAQPAGDLAGEAAAALKALDRDAAIKLVWTCEDDMRGGRYRPVTPHPVKGALDKGRHITSLDHVVVSQSIVKGSPFEAMIKDGIDPTMVEGADDLPYKMRNLRVTAHTMEVGVPVLWWRSVGHTHTAFATETFLDELLVGEITLDQGRVTQGNFNDYRMLRIHEMPKVEVVIVKSMGKPTGVGEPGVPPIGPAVANAWRALTGKAVRRLPFTQQPKAVAKSKVRTT